MQLKTILNRVARNKGFVFGAIRFVERAGRPTLEVEIRAHAKSWAICSRCERKCPGYDTLDERRFEFIPFWGIVVFFVYAMRRVECPMCGIKVERVPWAVGKHRLTTAYAWFLARWAKRMSWSEVAEAFRTTWHHVFCSVEMAVNWGREHMSLEGITAIGVDEMHWSHQLFITVVYQINEGRKRLLWVEAHRTAKSLLSFFHWLGPERSQCLEFVCSDMWQPYIKVIAKKASKAVHILDRFHIVSHLSKAIDKVRAEEARKMKANGFEPVLTNSRWCLLKRVENLTERQMDKLQDLLRFNLATVRAYLLKEQLQQFWEYDSPHWAGRFLDRWCDQAMRSRIDPMKRVARMLRKHRPLILNWFRARKQFSCGVVEGLNNKAKVISRKAYGFGTFYALRIALYHGLGNLPTPRFAHEFF
jgi:transposase